MTTPADINASIKKLIRSFVLFQAGLLAVSVALAVLFTGHFKQRLAGQLSAAVREALLSGDNRLAMVALPNSMSGDFSGVYWRPSGDTQAFDLPAGIKDSSGLLLAGAAVRLFFDEEKTTEAGTLYFYYPRLAPAAWGLLAWLAVLLLSLPLAYRERRRLLQEYQLMLDLEIKTSQASLAAQVAHDIRSPLAALTVAAKGFGSTEEQRALVDGAVGRMRAIADDLLARYRSPSLPRPDAAAAAEPAAGRPEACPLSEVVGQVIAEKKLQYADRAGVTIVFSAPAAGITAMADPKELQRVISNLVNNSVEAFAGGGTVSVTVSWMDGKALIEVRDDGKGIPPELLAKLGRKGETHGKAGGNGLGLYHARTSVESWGGSFKIGPGPGAGTSVLIELRTPAPAAARLAVLLDDDPLVHMNWKLSAKAAGVELKTYKTPADLYAAVGAFPRDTPLYIDSDLGDGLSGEQVAVKLRGEGFSEIAMATGHTAEKFAGLPWLKVTGKEPPFS